MITAFEKGRRAGKYPVRSRNHQADGTASSASTAKDHIGNRDINVNVGKKDLESLKAKVRGNHNKMSKIEAEQFASLSREEVSDMVEGVIDRILAHPEGRIPNEIVQGPRGPLRERVLNIHDLKIDKFIESDVEMIARQYTRTMSADVELTKKIGDVELETRIEHIRDGYNRAIERASDSKTRTKFEGEKKEARKLMRRRKPEWIVREKNDLLYNGVDAKNNGVRSGCRILSRRFNERIFNPFS